LYSLFNSNRIHSNEAQSFIAEKLKNRDQVKSIYLDNLLWSLDRLVTVAENQGVILGIENRYHYCELPTLGDFEIIFARFNGGPVGYWHDTGHAHVNESLTLIPPDSLLKAYSNQLIGIHLHDAFGLDDHLVPGTGQINFQRIKPFLKIDTLKVLELKSGTPHTAVSKAIRFTKDELLY
jgi:sugar phosphate isomerase/epimerase